MSASTESKIQADFHRYVWNKYPKTRYCCYHIPNEARRTAYSGMVAIGMIPGMPDYHVNFPSKDSIIEWRSMYIEFKKEGGILSENQKKVHVELRKNLHIVQVVYSFDEALKVFMQYAEGTEYLSK